MKKIILSLALFIGSITVMAEPKDNCEHSAREGLEADTAFTPGIPGIPNNSDSKRTRTTQ